MEWILNAEFIHIVKEELINSKLYTEWISTLYQEANVSL